MDLVKNDDKLKYIDLHTHTNISDGLLSPEELVQLAYQMNFKVLGITDHDNLKAIHRARAKAGKYNLIIIPGCELTAYRQGLEIHILAYFIEPDNSYFNAYLKKFTEARYIRAQDIVNRLRRLGLHIDFEEIRNRFSSDVIGRPHIARELIFKNHARNIKEAFNRYLMPGRPGYVPKFQITPEEIIDLIRQSGGVPVLAHPYYYSNYKEIIRELAYFGLKGLEVYHAKHTPFYTRIYKRLALRHHLVMTGGSDAHSGAQGDYLPFGKIKISDDLLGPLEQARDEIQNMAQAKLS